MLEQIKKSLRITHDLLDENLTSDIYAAALDLKRVGVMPYEAENGNVVINIDGNPEIKDDALIRKAIELFVKGFEDFEGKGETYSKAYERLRDGLSLSGDYSE